MSENPLSEFRQDLVSGDWVLFSTVRSQRPHAFRSNQDTDNGINNCPFEDLTVSGNEIIWGYPDNGMSAVTLIKNKFPAVVTNAPEASLEIQGPYSVLPASGHHELFVFKDHQRQLADLSFDELTEVIRAYKKRKVELSKEPANKYVLIFHNAGLEAGASIYHPHSQLLAIPILPPQVAHSFHGAQRFFQKHGRSVYEVMIDWERKQDERIIHESEHFVAFCPFASRSPYEVRIFPKTSHAHFERLPTELDSEFATMLGTVLKKLKQTLDTPDYNLFFHSAPSDEVLPNLHQFYTWHVEISPRLAIHAGFEEATGIIINATDPDAAALALRQSNV